MDTPSSPYCQFNHLFNSYVNSLCLLFSKPNASLVFCISHVFCTLQFAAAVTPPLYCSIGSLSLPDLSHEHKLSNTPPLKNVRKKNNISLWLLISYPSISQLY